MKINDAEQLLGVTKANLRFYEKEGLITPQRSENGYRDYSEDDIIRLKEIIVLRKLGIPVQQIADILDGVLPLQEALDTNILSLQEEIRKLNGSLELCRQLKAEAAQTLDPERYWTILQEKEQQGFAFQTLAGDYFHFIDRHIRGRWFSPRSQEHNNLSVILITLLFCTGASLLRTWAGSRTFTKNLEFYLSLKFIFPFIIGIFLIPAFLVERKNPKYGPMAHAIMKGLLVLVMLYFGLRRIFT